MLRRNAALIALALALTVAALGALAALAIALAATPAAASEPTPAECAASYPERLADAQHAIGAQAAYIARWQRVMPWFEAHCRPLSALERAVRKIDDPAAFVCDSKKGRPRELTTRFLAEHPEPLDTVIFVELAHLDDLCAAADVAEGRPSLVLREPTAAQTLAVVCYQSTRPSCVRVRQLLAAGSAP